MIEITVAVTPRTNIQTLKGWSKFNSESPAPKNTTAAERGSIPKNVPTKNDLSGTLAEDIKKFVRAKGIAGDSRSRKIISVVRQTLCPINAS